MYYFILLWNHFWSRTNEEDLIQCCDVVPTLWINLQVCLWGMQHCPLPVELLSGYQMGLCYMDILICPDVDSYLWDFHRRVIESVWGQKKNPLWPLLQQHNRGNSESVMLKMSCEMSSHSHKPALTAVKQIFIIIFVANQRKSEKAQVTKPSV